MDQSYKVAVAGLGYVGMSLAVLLARRHEVVAFDIDRSRVEKVNAGFATVADPEMEKILQEGQINLRAKLDPAEVFPGADFVIVAVPTNYDEVAHHFDTSAVENVIRTARKFNKSAFIVIKSTIPVGFTESQQEALDDHKLTFSPEFLREGKALFDNLHPSRIVVGDHSKDARAFAEMLRDASLEPEVKILLTGPNEAEAIKLFSNSYLAARISFFNELDSFGMAKGLDVQDIITGVCMDPRIGPGYNNPSFGYGGYCLPKDTKQLLANYRDIPHQLIQSVVDANVSRKKFVAERIIAQAGDTIGVYRLTMKQGSDNMKNSATYDILKHLVAEGANVVVYEPMLSAEELPNVELIKDLSEFLQRVDLLVCNRRDQRIKKFAGRVFTRDIFCVD